MPEYKKKRVRKIARRPKTRERERIKLQENIPMSRSVRNRGQQEEKTVRVIKGKKLEQRRNLKIAAAAALVIAVAACILHYTLPIGIAENIGNLTASLGSGEYPIELYGTETLNSVQRGNYYYVLTDTNFGAYSGSGKKIFTYAHGYAHPVIKTSQTRSLIFDQGGTGLQIYNLSKTTNELTSEQPILTAAISRCGAYAVAAKSDSYSAAVTVYNRRDEQMYEWYSSADAVNGILLSPDGKQLAVSTVNAADGTLKSRLLILKYNSADPVFSTEYSDTAVYSLECLNSGFTAVTAKGCSYFSWSDYKRTDFYNDYIPSASKITPAGLTLVFSRVSDKSDNRIVVISHNGEQLASFDFKGQISDIAFSDNHIYCISDTNVYMLDKKGERIASAECGFGAVRLAVTGSRTAAVISNGDITKINFS